MKQKLTAMKTIKKIQIAALGILLATSSMAEKPESTSFFLNNDSRYYKTKFVLASNLMVLPLQINNSCSMNFVFDTGVGRTIITQTTNPEAISTSQFRRVLVRGLGSNESIVGVLSSNNDLSLGEISDDNHEILVVPNNIINLSSSLGYEINGVTGRSFFEQFVVEIDYLKQTVQFHNPSQFNRKIRSNDDVVPIELIDGRPYITANVTINGKEIPVKLLFDTGMSFPLWLDPSTNENFKPTGLCRHDDFGQGLNGNVSGEISRVEKLRIGKFELKNVITAFPNANAIRDVTVNSDRNGSVGADIFRRFNVIIDYQNKRVILRKNATFKEEFTYDMSGISIETILPEFPFYRIASIGENTPASECGLQVNDEILKINARNTRNMSMNDIVCLLKKREGKKIRITVLRNGEIIKLKFRLKRLV